MQIINNDYDDKIIDDINKKIKRQTNYNEFSSHIQPPGEANQTYNDLQSSEGADMQWHSDFSKKGHHSYKRNGDQDNLKNN